MNLRIILTNVIQILLLKYVIITINEHTKLELYNLLKVLEYEYFCFEHELYIILSNIINVNFKWY